MSEFPNEEEIIQRHKQEKKELQSKIQSLKKSVPKGDKKKKKEIFQQITELEKEMEDRHDADLEPFKMFNNDDETSKDETNFNEEDCENVIKQNELNTSDVRGGLRISKAQRRRDKKALEEAEREKRILAEKEKCRDGPKAMEMNSIREVLRGMGLGLHDIAADGNCLYCAVSHQLEVKNQETFTVTKLRKLTAGFMKENKDDFLPFMYNDSGETVSETYFDEYCKEVASTKLWGGQLELKALSNILKCPIKVIQASGPPTTLGEDFSGPELILTYHRYLYRLGEHYNSTVLLNDDN